MPDLSREELWNHLKRGSLASVYVLFGAESFLRDRAALAIVDRSFGESDLRDFNYDEFVLNGKQGIQSVIAASEQLPMMSARRVVKVSDVRVSSTSARDTLREDDEERLARYLADPAPSTVLIFVADEFNGTRKLTRLLKKHATTVEFKNLETSDLIAWIKRAADEAGSEFDDTALRLLIDLVGPNLRRLSNEIQKLSAAALPGRRISYDLVERLVSFSDQLENFALTDALISGRPQNTLRAMRKVLDSGGEPVALIGLLSYNIRRLLMAKEMMSRGQPREQIAPVLGRMRYQDQQDFLAAARRASRDDLLSIVRRLRETDLAMKTSVGGGGPQGTQMQLELLVCEIAQRMSGN